MEGVMSWVGGVWAGRGKQRPYLRPPWSFAETTAGRGKQRPYRWRARILFNLSSSALARPPTTRFS